VGMTLCSGESGGRMDVFSDHFYCRKNVGLMPVIC
jgi:hypothetical protein